MSGLHRLRPPDEVPMPHWLLSDLLAFLRSPLFEPLSLASDYYVFAKTLVLLLLATGRRISEIAGLARDFKETNKITVTVGEELYFKTLDSRLPPLVSVLHPLNRCPR